MNAVCSHCGEPMEHQFTEWPGDGFSHPVAFFACSTSSCPHYGELRQIEGVRL